MKEKDFLRLIEQDLYEVNRSIQLQLRAVSNYDPKCSACVNASVNSTVINLYSVIGKIRDRMSKTTSLYELLRENIVDLQGNFKSGKISKDEYKLGVSKLRFLISEIEMAARDIDDEEVPDSLVIKILTKQLSNIEDMLVYSPNDESLSYERDLINGLLPEEADEAEIDEAISNYIDENPDAKMGDIIGHVSKNYYFNKGKLALKVKHRLKG